MKFRLFSILLTAWLTIAGRVSFAEPTAAQVPDSTLEKQGEEYFSQFKHYNRLNEHEKALSYLRQGLTLLDGRRHLPAWNMLAMQQGEMQKLLGRRPEAIATYRLCLENARTDADRAKIYNRLAAVFIENHKVDSCLYYTDKSETLSKKLPPNPQLQVWNDHLTGVAYMNTDRSKSRFYLERGLDLAMTADPDNVTILLSHLAVLAAKDGNLAQSRDIYLEAARTALQSGAILNHLWVFHNLASVYHQLGQDKEAYHWLSLKDSAEFVNRKEQIAQVVATLGNEVSLARASQSQAVLEHDKATAEVRSFWALVMLGVVVIACAVLFFTLRKVNKQQAALKLAHAELDTLARGLKRNTQDLELANRTKALMLSVIGHDLRSPLASLQGIMGLVNDVDLSQAEFKVLAERISQDVTESRHLLDDLLLWAKSQMEGLRVDIGEQDAAQLLTVATRQQRALAEQRQVIVETEVESSSPILADAGLLKTVLRNLVGNAIQHSPVGATVNLSIAERGNQCRITVLNSHAQMQEEDRVLLTSNLPGALQRRLTARNGFGLILIKDFILLMNGRAEVELPSAGGTAVTIVLPLAKTASKPAASEAVVEQA